MRVSELVERTGVPLPTIKYYLREGLLHPGEAVSRTQASYDEGHVQRVGVIRVLTDVVGLSVQNAAAILRLVDDPHPDLFATLGEAVSLLPPQIDDATGPHPRASAALAELGLSDAAPYAAVAQLERALEATEIAGIPMTGDRLRVYGDAIRRIAEYDIVHTPPTPRGAVEYSVLGTALYEPVLVALRRLAHRDIAAARLGVTDISAVHLSSRTEPRDEPS